jgi:ABC-type amino acid transport substrate-binding protein
MIPRMMSGRMEAALAALGWLAILFACESAPADANAASEVLTDPQRAWVAGQAPIRFAPERDYGPFVYVENDGTLAGLSVDYIRAISRVTGLPVEYLPAAPLDSNLALARQGQVDLISSVRPTPERSQYLGFTTPYVSIPAVVVTRRDGNAPASLDRYAGLRVAVGRSYAVESFVRSRFPAVEWIPVQDDLEGLQGVRERRFAAAVADTASVHFILKRHGIEGLQARDPVGFEYSLSFAYRHDWPMLGEILEQGLRAITSAERQGLHDKWVAPYQQTSGRSVEEKLVAIGTGLIAAALLVRFGLRLMRAGRKGAG